MALSRRRFLALGAGVVGVGGAALALEPKWRVHAVDAIRNEERHFTPHGTPADVSIVSGSFVSAARGGVQTGWSLAIPRQAGTDRPLPLVVALHGRSGDHTGAFGSLDMDRALAEAVKTGSTPFLLAAVDGGNHSYYHRREDGSDVGEMIVNELPHQLRQQASLDGRLALTGWSMGGYGALHLAQHYGPSKIHAVAASSAALWDRWQDSAPGAYDGPADFAANSVLDHLDQLTVPTRITCGRHDPFIATNRELARRRPDVHHEFPEGVHNNVFWRSTNLAQLRFLAATFT